MIICLEGINGCGKTTVGGAIAAAWSAVGGRHARVTDPVQLTEFGKQVRTAIMGAEALTADAETLAFVSARLDSASILDGRPTDDGNLLILERWAGAVVAYGTVAGTNPFLLLALEGVLAGALPIDHTFLIDVPGTAATERLAHLADTNRFETSGPDYLERVRRQYLVWASVRHIPVISGLQPTSQQAKTIHHLIAPEITGVSTIPSALDVTDVTTATRH